MLEINMHAVSLKGILSSEVNKLSIIYSCVHAAADIQVKPTSGRQSCKLHRRSNRHITSRALVISLTISLQRYDNVTEFG